MKLHVRSMLFRSPRSKLLAAMASFAAIALSSHCSCRPPQPHGKAASAALANGGVLLLHLGSSGTAPQDYLGFRSPSGTGYAAISQKQSITNGQGCKIALGTVASASNPLVTFSPQTDSGQNPSTGFVADAIGVGQNGEGNGQPCGRIDNPPGQALTMNLGSALGGKLIEYAEIDVELKFGGHPHGHRSRATRTQVGGAETTGRADRTRVPIPADGDNYRIRFPRRARRPSTN